MPGIPTENLNVIPVLCGKPVHPLSKRTHRQAASCRSEEGRGRCPLRLSFGLFLGKNFATPTLAGFHPSSHIRLEDVHRLTVNGRFGNILLVHSVSYSCWKSSPSPPRRAERPSLPARNFVRSVCLATASLVAEPGRLCGAGRVTCMLRMCSPSTVPALFSFISTSPLVDCSSPPRTSCSRWARCNQYYWDLRVRSISRFTSRSLIDSRLSAFFLPRARANESLMCRPLLYNDSGIAVKPWRSVC